MAASTWPAMLKPSAIDEICFLRFPTDGRAKRSELFLGASENVGAREELDNSGDSLLRRHARIENCYRRLSKKLLRLCEY